MISKVSHRRHGIIPFENRRQILVTHGATETERIEEMRRDFIANASHELRTPLTVIVGFLEIAASEGLDVATRSAHLKLMTEQGHRMQHLIEDMLTLSRLDSVDYPMRPEHISRLTERFYRVDKSRSRETQGTGLGLAIVKHVLLRHGSTLQIKSEAGKGSSFIVCLPKTAVVQRQPELMLN